MSARIIDGKAIAAEVVGEVSAGVERLAARGIRPGLAVIRVGHDPASEVYVRSKERKAREVGIEGIHHHLSEEITQDDLAAELARFNQDDRIDGILLQLPLPPHLDARPLLDSIDPAKDVDGFHPVNAGRLQQGRPCLAPCTPLGVVRLIESTGVPIRGAHAVVIGRSDIVGKPVAAMLLQRDATVTICHSRTPDLDEQTRDADIVIAAVGRPLLLRASGVRQGAVVVDVGINRLEHSDDTVKLLRDDAIKSALLAKNGSVLVGDVDFAGVRERASWITPVPGGVGPMTIAMLLRNTVQAAEARRG